jgi:hypothetical protein
MKSEAVLRIVLEEPPPGVDFGIQKGRGSSFETIGKQRSLGGDLVFEIRVEIKTGRASGAPALAGPLVQGPPDQRFLYVGIGTFAGDAGSKWQRRLKVPLTGISQETIRELSSASGAILETRVAGTGRDGGPNCGTVKPFAGWNLLRSR